MMNHKNIYIIFRNILLILLLFYYLNPIYSEYKYFWSKNEPLVGDEVYLTVETENQNSELLEPESGYVSLPNGLPYMEVISHSKEGTRIILQVRFTKAGKHDFQVKWKTDKETEHIGISISVSSVLGPNDKETLDIAEPLEFSGPYGLRLFLIILGFSVIVAILYYFFLHRKPSKKNVKDAGIVTPIEAEKLEPIDIVLERLLTNKEIQHKEFVYVLSDYLKSALSQKLESDITYMTQSELEDILKSKLNLSEKVVHEFSLYLNSIKYMPNEERILSDNARAIRNYWERTLQL